MRVGSVTIGVALVSGALVVAALATYWPVTRHEFINHDDPLYVTENPHVRAGLTWESLAWAFKTGHASNWHPLTWVSLMLDSELYGDCPGGFHLTNLLFHTANTLILFIVLRMMTGAFWPSAFVAAMFALHPLHVESVAWVAERKDVLSTFLGFLALLCYVQFAKRKPIGPQSCLPAQKTPETYLGDPGKMLRWYWASVVFFALGLMSKPMLVTWPFLMLLLDYWPLRRIIASNQNAHRPARTVGYRLCLLPAVVEKLPFFALSFASSVVTLIVQRRGGAVQALAALPLDARIENALIAYATYILKMFWPANLALPYLYLPPHVWPVWHGLGATLLLAFISVLVLKARRAYLVVGWLWFIGTLVPVIGLVQVGNQSMADRYTYVPLVGLFLMLAWAGAELYRRVRQLRFLVLILAGAAILGCIWQTRIQLGYWRDAETLFSHTIAVTKDNCVAHDILAHALLKKGELDRAKRHFLEAIRIRLKYGNTQNAELLHNVAVVALQQGNTAEAKDYLYQAMQTRSYPADVPAKLALVLTTEGNIAEAIAMYKRALEIKPDSPDVLNNLAWLLAAGPEDALRNGQEAARLAERACELTGYKQALFVGTLAAAYAEAGRFDDAIRTAEKARALAEAAGQTNLVLRNEELIRLYRAGKPYRDPALAPKTDAQ